MEQVGQHVLVGVPVLHRPQVGERRRGEGLHPGGGVGGCRHRGGPLPPGPFQLARQTGVLLRQPVQLPRALLLQTRAFGRERLRELGALLREFVDEPLLLLARLLGRTGLLLEQPSDVLGDALQPAPGAARGPQGVRGRGHGRAEHDRRRARADGERGAHRVRGRRHGRADHERRQHTGHGEGGDERTEGRSVAGMRGRGHRSGLILAAETAGWGGAGRNVGW